MSNPYINNQSKNCLLFTQHGWADTCDGIGKLATALSTPQTQVINPDLGFLKTFLAIKPLINQVEAIAIKNINTDPHLPIKIIGHSMGGLIWLEILSRHPEWWQKVQSLILITSPVGGSHLARIIDPFSWGIGIAKDLGINRRYLAEEIAQVIPTLIIASDVKYGNDLVVNIETMKFRYAQFICLSNIGHAAMRNHSSIVPIIKNFWQNPVHNPPNNHDFTTWLIQKIQSLPGMTDGNWKNFEQSQPYIIFPNDVTINLWKNPLQVVHLFITNPQKQQLYSGFVGWIHTLNIYKNLAQLKKLNIRV